MKQINRKIISLIVMIAVMLMIAPATVTQAAGVELTAQNDDAYRYCSNYSDYIDGNTISKSANILMEKGQSVKVSNLVFKKTNKKERPLAYCESTAGFKATSKNKGIVTIKNGKIYAVSEGKTVVTVKKNNQKFTFQIEVREPNYSLSSDYKWINQYIVALARKYPDAAAVRKNGSTFIKSMVKLNDRINDLEWKIYRSEVEEADGIGYQGPYVYLSGVLGKENVYFLGIEDPREYFRLCELARDYIQVKSKVARDLKIDGVEVVQTRDYGKRKDYDINISLKNDITFSQCLESYAKYDPYNSYSGMLSNSNKPVLLCRGILCKIKGSGREFELDDVYMVGNYKENTISTYTCSVKPGKYKIYFNVAGASDPKKYSVEFTLE